MEPTYLSPDPARAATPEPGRSIQSEVSEVDAVLKRIHDRQLEAQVVADLLDFFSPIPFLAGAGCAELCGQQAYLPGSQCPNNAVLHWCSCLQPAASSLLTLSQTEEDELTFRLSQDTAAEDRVQRMVHNSRALRNLRKPVHFFKNLHRYE